VLVLRATLVFRSLLVPLAFWRAAGMLSMGSLHRRMVIIAAPSVVLPPGVGVCAAASTGGSARPVRFLADLGRFELF
jgi:hypothetical protein